MAVNYTFALDLSLLPTTTKATASQPRASIQFEANNGTRWIAGADFGGAVARLFQIAGTDGIVQSQATITANTAITKTGGTQPGSITQFQANDGTRWLATADYGSNRVSLFQVAGTDGNIQSQATITANTLLTKTVGTQPLSVAQFQATDGTRWIATADLGSNRVSLFQIAGTDGNVQDQATITANTLITKTVGTQARSLVQFQAADGTRWLATADYGSNRVSLFQIAGTDGNVQDQATITANTAITKTVGTQPIWVAQFQAADGTRWIATADHGSTRVSLFQMGGTDGNVQSQVTITSNTVITKTVGKNPFSIVHFQAANGTRWLAPSENAIDRASLFPIGGTD